MIKNGKKSSFFLVRSDGTQFTERKHRRPGTARHSIFDAFTDPHSHQSVKIGDHFYTIPTDQYTPGTDPSKLPQMAVHVFRVTAQDVVRENHGPR